jgi:hypothetical protein
MPPRRTPLASVAYDREAKVWVIVDSAIPDCSGRFRLERLPGGSCTHWKAPPFTAHTLCGRSIYRRSVPNSDTTIQMRPSRCGNAGGRALERGRPPRYQPEWRAWMDAHRGRTPTLLRPTVP